jgi:hypothetical protein
MNKNTAFKTVKKEDPPAPKANDQPETFFHAETFSESLYSSDSFGCKRNDSDKQKMFFFDPDDISEKGRFGRAFHLTLNFNTFPTTREEPRIFVR